MHSIVLMQRTAVCRIAVQCRAFFLSLPLSARVVRFSVSRMRNFSFLIVLEDTARYAGLLLAPPEGFGRGFFCPSGKKRAYYAVLAHFWHFLVSSSNLGNF